MNPPRPLAALAVTSALFLAVCGDDDDSATATSVTTEVASDSEAGTAASEPLVEIERSRYLPPEITVEAGTEVRFVNLDRATHTVTARSESDLQFDSGDLGQDDEFTQVFNDPGTFAYFCEIHPTMRATVVVE